MANSPQAKKRARQIERRTAVNKARKSRIRTFLRAVEEAIASGDKAAATEAAADRFFEYAANLTTSRTPLTLFPVGDVNRLPIDRQRRLMDCF